MEIPKKLKDEVWDYCRVNSISNIDEFILKLLTQGFTIEKFGATPSTKEKIVEKIVEVEKIIEKIVEVPVEKIIEKVIEKEVYITDNSEAKKLTDRIDELIENEKYCRVANLTMQVTVKTLGEEKEKLSFELEEVKKQLAELKTKNKKDLYGE